MKKKACVCVWEGVRPEKTIKNKNQSAERDGVSAKSRVKGRKEDLPESHSEPGRIETKSSDDYDIDDGMVGKKA